MSEALVTQYYRHGDSALAMYMFVILFQVEVHGIPPDQALAETAFVKNNGFNPRWNETMRFRVTCPQLALVMFRVLDDIPGSRNITVAQYCLPMRCLQTGYRMVELWDMQGERLGPTGLLVHITIDKPAV